ncbi:MAG: M3 family metallopeptidase [Bdellovibrionales bacterium]
MSSEPSVAFDPSNPLMNPPDLPFGVPPLDLVRNEHILPAVRWAIGKAREDITAIKADAAPASFKTVFEALELAGQDITRIGAIFANLSSSNSSDEMREIEEVVDLEMARYHSDVSLDEALFNRIKQAYEACDKASLTKEQGMLMEESYKGFVRSGALLNDQDKASMRGLNEKLAQATTLFGNHIVKATEAYKKLILDEAELDGVPDRAKKLYRRLAQEAGHDSGFLITLEPYPIDITTHGTNRALREELYRAYACRCYKDSYDNLPLIPQLVALRHDRAKLMGYDSFAAFVLENRMAGSVQAVMDFLQNNLATYKPAAQKELERIKALARQDGVDPIKPWDVAFYARRLKEETFHLELETLRPYFNLEKVLDGIRAHVERLFGVEMRLETSGRYPTYHPDVKTYEIFDTASGEIIGLFYGDYYARPGAKRGGAWMSTFRDRSVENGRVNLPIVINNCNFAKPSAEHPTFLSLGEVEALFHEFGHALHALLSTATYASLAGPNVKWDFVELPSQVQERWITQKEVLDTFARHHETGELISAELVETIQAMQNFDAGSMGLTQTFYGMLDMAFHANDPASMPDPETLEKEIADRVVLIKREAGLMATSFSHIFAGGYGAGYYSYKWAEALDADVFSAFKTKGLYDPELSRKLRTLYAKGGTEPPMDIFVEMMGRKPDPAALYRLSGLSPAVKSS